MKLFISTLTTYRLHIIICSTFIDILLARQHLILDIAYICIYFINVIFDICCVTSGTPMCCQMFGSNYQHPS